MAYKRGVVQPVSERASRLSRAEQHSPFAKEMLPKRTDLRQPINTVSGILAPMSNPHFGSLPLHKIGCMVIGTVCRWFTSKHDPHLSIERLLTFLVIALCRLIDQPLAGPKIHCRVYV